MRLPRKWLMTGALAALLAYLSSGLYFVQPDERGVVRWFGRVPAAYRSVPPGLHYALPWPFCEVDSPTTTEVRRLYVGLLPEQREAIAGGDMQAIEASPDSDMLTGDVNILKTTMVVQYQVVDPAAFLFGTDRPQRLIQDTVQAVLIETLAGMPVDQALTAAKAKLQFDTVTRAQQLLDEYGCGVQLVAANIESIEPPRAIITAFQDVVSAMKDGERTVDRAVAETNRILSGARGESARITEEAEGYRQSRISRARGEADRFLAVLTEYRKDPEVFRHRLILQTLENVLPRIRTYILDNQPGDPPTSLRLLEAGDE